MEQKQPLLIWRKALAVPCGCGTARRANAPAWRANAPAWRANAPARRANAPARRANTPARRANASAWRADAPARRANAPAWRSNAPARDGKRSARRFSGGSFLLRSLCLGKFLVVLEIAVQRKVHSKHQIDPIMNFLQGGTRKVLGIYAPTSSGKFY